MSATAATDTVPLAPGPRWIGRRDESPLERMPLLAELLAESARAWTEGFGALAGTPAETTFEGCTIAKVEELAERRGAAAFLAAVEAPEWGAEIALHFDRAFLVTMVEALFGGDGDDGDIQTGDVPSPVELRIADLMGRHVAEALATGFAARLPTTFRFDRLLAKPDLGFLGRPNAAVVAARFVTRTLGRVASLDVLIPQAALEPLADRLGAETAAVVETGDPRWSRRLEAEIGRAMTTLQAAIEIPAMTLGAVARFKPGQILRLPLAAGSDVRLVCGDGALFRCDLGQSAGAYTVRIEDALGAAASDRPPAASPTGDIG